MEKLGLFLSVVFLLQHALVYAARPNPPEQTLPLEQQTGSINEDQVLMDRRKLMPNYSYGYHSPQLGFGGSGQSSSGGLGSTYGGYGQNGAGYSQNSGSYGGSGYGYGGAYNDPHNVITDPTPSYDLYGPPTIPIYEPPPTSITAHAPPMFGLHPMPFTAPVVPNNRNPGPFLPMAPPMRGCPPLADKKTISPINLAPSGPLPDPQQPPNANASPESQGTVTLDVHPTPVVGADSLPQDSIVSGTGTLEHESTMEEGPKVKHESTMEGGPKVKHGSTMEEEPKVQEIPGQ